MLVFFFLLLKPTHRQHQLDLRIDVWAAFRRVGAALGYLNSRVDVAVCLPRNFSSSARLGSARRAALGELLRGFSSRVSPGTWPDPEIDTRLCQLADPLADPAAHAPPLRCVVLREKPGRHECCFFCFFYFLWNNREPAFHYLPGFCLTECLQDALTTALKGPIMQNLLY